MTTTYSKRLCLLNALRIGTHALQEELVLKPPKPDVGSRLLGYAVDNVSVYPDEYTGGDVWIVLQLSAVKTAVAIDKRCRLVECRLRALGWALDARRATR